MSSLRCSRDLQYVPPEGASDENQARVRYLINLRKSSLTKREREQAAAAGKPTERLQDLAAKFDSGRQRFIPPVAKKNLRNTEFLIALILDGEGRSDAVPPKWREPIDIKVDRKKDSSLEPVSDIAATAPAPAMLTFDHFDLSRYLSLLTSMATCLLCRKKTC
jgi:hypothetical protein